MGSVQSLFSFSLALFLPVHTSPSLPTAHLVACVTAFPSSLIPETPKTPNTSLFQQGMLWGEMKKG